MESINLFIEFYETEEFDQNLILASLGEYVPTATTDAEIELYDSIERQIAREEIDNYYETESSDETDSSDVYNNYIEELYYERQYTEAERKEDEAYEM